MSSCFGFRKSTSDDRRPLLPQYNDDTSLQREVHQKLHSYQMLRALSKGYMPTTEQLIVNLRTVLASDVLNPDNPDLSQSGRRLVRFSKQWLQQFIDLLQHKDGDDQVQTFISYLSRSRIDVDAEDLAVRAATARAKADTVAAYQCLRTVGNLLLANSDFRIFLSDLNTVLREVFKDSAFTLSKVSKQVGKKLEPSAEERKALSGPGADSGPAPSGKELGNQVAEVSKVVGNGVLKVADETQHSLADKLSGDEKETMISRLQQAILKLKKRPDYSDSVSIIALLIKRYAKVYSRAVDETVKAAEEDVHTNPELDRAMAKLWSFLTSFGDRAQWEELERRFKTVMEHGQKDVRFEKVVTDVANSLQSLLTDPDFLGHAGDKFKELKEKVGTTGEGSSFSQDIDGLLEQLHKTFESVTQDPDVAQLLNTTTKIVHVLSPKEAYVNRDLMQDAANVFIPLLIQAVQYVPIPRIEVSTPDIDLLLENLILEPGQTVNNSSFLPYRLRVNTNNDFLLWKARTRTTSAAMATVTVELDGLSVRATDVGYWMRVHSGLVHFTDSGLASFALDGRGLDVKVVFDVRRDRAETILTLRRVTAKAHKLCYNLRRSKFSFLAWLFGPLLRPIIRKAIEHQVAAAIADALRTADRELVFARERLRATRIADPADLATFIRAVAARWQPEQDPDVHLRIGVDQPGARAGVFAGVYAPGSVVKLWHEEADQAEERIEEGEVRVDSWRNQVFDVQTALA